MKTTKSPENTEVTPSKKKLKQARLPFKLISEVSTSPVTPQARKRKLSAAEAEPIAKVGKKSKENDVSEDPIVLSDDEIPTKIIVQEAKTLNPYVKLVDTAWKKKLQKSKKKKVDKKRSSATNESVDSASEDNLPDTKNVVELMDVDLPTQSNEDKACNGDTEFEIESDRDIKKTPRQSKPETESEIESDRDIKKTPSPSKPEAETEIESDRDIKKTPRPSKPEAETEIESDRDIESTPKQTNRETRSKTSILKLKTLPKDSSKCDDKITNTGKCSETSDKEEDSDKISCEVESELNVSNGNPSTPINRSLSTTNSLDESLNGSTLSNLTPKQLQKKLEASKKKEEREKEKHEREKKKQQEKEEKARQRQEKEDQKKKEREEKEEAKRKEREEKEELKKKEREEKEKQKELEKKLKEEKEEQKRKEREEKEEQKRKEKEAKEEEKRKKQEALELEKQEQELKKKKAAEAFVNFFVPKQKSEKDQPTEGPVSKSSVLSSFAIKSDMRLAPTVRVDLSEDKKEKLDNLLDEQRSNESGLYLKVLKEGSTKPMSSGKTWPLSDKNEDDDDVVIVEDELPPLDSAEEILTCDPVIREKLRPKLLSFHDNRRPPYWGTWRKKSAAIKPRRPFGQDDKQLDYEVDSDEEWEEEQEGESIDGSAAGSDDEQDADEYEVDNEVFVPHGYLSDEEATMDDDDVLSLSPETQKAKLKHLEDEFESEMKKPTEKLKPRLFGILWETADGGKPENCVDSLWNYFGKWSMIMNDPTPFLQPSTEPEETEKKKSKKKKVPNEGDNPSPKSDKKKKPKPENKETKLKNDSKKNTPEVKKSQPGINTFLTKIKST